VKRTILIVDSNLAFVFQLGRTLEAAGHKVLPARGASDAKALLSELHLPVDLVVIHRDTPNARCLLEELRCSQGQISVVDLCGDEQQHSRSHERLAYRQRLPFTLPWLQSPVSKSECLAVVEQFLASSYEENARQELLTEFHESLLDKRTLAGPPVDDGPI
jgi:DNA-binding response OmpR family regulator